jgi:hypothetical protein
MTENTKPLVGGYDSNGGTRTAPPAAARFNWVRSIAPRSSMPTKLGANRAASSAKPVLGSRLDRQQVATDFDAPNS